MKQTALKHEFVEYIPDVLQDGRLYISIRFATAVHKCCCGCGHEVVTPLSPRDWKLIFDGETVSLDPSIGNWSFPCQSHYWIRRNRIVSARRWTKNEIDAARADERSTYAADSGSIRATTGQTEQPTGSRRKRLWQALTNRRNRK
jgi:hypothetical protein